MGKVTPGLFTQEIMEVQPMTAPTGLLFELFYPLKETEMRALHGITIKANRDEVLDALRENREEHVEIVAEAKAGYLKKVEEALGKKLADVKEDRVKATDSIVINLSPPVDRTKVYDRAIKIFELDTQEIIELTQEQVGCFVMDDWEWKQEFIGSNRLYSAKARGLL